MVIHELNLHKVSYNLFLVFLYKHCTRLILLVYGVHDHRLCVSFVREYRCEMDWRVGYKCVESFGHTQWIRYIIKCQQMAENLILDADAHNENLAQTSIFLSLS